VLIIVHKHLVEIDAAVMNGQILADELNEGFLAVRVDAHQSHDFALKNMQVKIIQQGHLVPDDGDPFQP